MTLSRGSWVRYTEGLQPGRSVRVDHDCGTGRTLIVENKGDGFTAWCFRCSEGDGFRVEVSLQDRLAGIARLSQADAACAELQRPPAPATLAVDDWSDAARLWLYGAGFSRADIGRLGIYFHEPTQRVVLPTTCGRYWQARAVQPWRKPKYLSASPKPADLLARWGKSGVPTLTEDMLSAMKVGDVGEGWAILGTSVSDHMISEIMRRGNRVNLWTDPDAAGRKAAAKYGRQLRGFGVEVRNILSERDPKRHTRAEIAEYLCAPSARTPTTA